MSKLSRRATARGGKMRFRRVIRRRWGRVVSICELFGGFSCLVGVGGLSVKFGELTGVEVARDVCYLVAIKYRGSTIYTILRGMQEGRKTREETETQKEKIKVYLLVHSRGLNPVTATLIYRRHLSGHLRMRGVFDAAQDM